MTYLGIDAGGSATRWALVDARGDVAARGEADGFSGHLFDPAVLKRAEAALDRIFREAMVFGAVEGAHVGVTGLSADTPEAEWIAAKLSAACGLPAGRCIVEDDVSVAYRACFRPGEGVLVYAGTGSLALHLTASGERWRAGGHGILIDDDGSAAWIARQALRRLLAAEDAEPGKGWGTALGQAFASRFGGADWASARVFVYGAHRGAIGELARAVAEAGGVGDPIASLVFAEAGEALALLARTLLARAGPLPLRLAGGSLRLSPTIGEAFVRAVGDRGQAAMADIDAALTAARLAAENQLSPERT